MPSETSAAILFAQKNPKFAGLFNLLRKSNTNIPKINWQLKSHFYLIRINKEVVVIY